MVTAVTGALTVPDKATFCVVVPAEATVKILEYEPVAAVEEILTYIVVEETVPAAGVNETDVA
jgi:hypothetical protein